MLCCVVLCCVVLLCCVVVLLWCAGVFVRLDMVVLGWMCVLCSVAVLVLVLVLLWLWSLSDLFVCGAVFVVFMYVCV